MKRKPLTDAELSERFNKRDMKRWSLAKLGGVMIGDEVVSGRAVCDMGFRDEPDMSVPFSGWTFFSSKHPKDNIELHDCLAILRVAPEIAQYLDLPPGRNLTRVNDTTFAVEMDDNA
jgi:hypothetical protein